MIDDYNSYFKITAIIFGNAIFRQIPPFLSAIPGTVITYQLNLYIRTDGLRFTRY